MNMKQISPYPLRLDPSLKGYLTEQAIRNFRSLHAEIVFRLEESRTKENAPEAATSEALVQ